MEGERILKAISNGEPMEKLVTDLQNYLHPLVAGKARSKKVDIRKYQLFALKALKLTIQMLTHHHESHDITTSHMFLKLAEVCVVSMRSHFFVDQRIAPFSFEKLLVHLANQAVHFVTMETVLLCVEVMKERLVVNHNKDKGKEVESLMRNISDVLWKAALHLDHQSVTMVIKLRQHSIEALLISSAHFPLAIERAIICLKGGVAYGDVLNMLVTHSESVGTSQAHKLCIILLQISVQLSCLTTFTFPPSLVTLFTQCTSTLTAVNVSSFSTSSLNIIIKAIENVATGISRLQKISRETSHVTHVTYQNLKKLLFFYNDCVDSQLQATPTENRNRLESSAKSRQLSALNITANVLLDCLMTVKDDSSHDLVIDCLPLVQRSKVILDSCSSLPVAEYKWFGISAYNLGLLLYQMEEWRHAIPLLQIACGHLCHWCHMTSDDVTDEVKLIKKYSLLLDCLHKDHQYNVAMETISSIMKSLPTNQIADHNHMTTLVSHFVKTKRLIRREEHCEDKLLSMRDVLSGCHDNKVIILYLEEELNQYHCLKEDTTLWELFVIQQLLSLYKGRTHSINHARLLIKQASLYHKLEDEDSLDHTPLNMLDEAIGILESCDSVGVAEKQCLTLDLLGLAHLWKSICLHTQHVNSGTSDHSILDNDVFQCLQSAVNYWKTSWEMISHDSIPPSKHRECFHHFITTCNHLHLCVSLCHIFHLSSLTFHTLNTLISLCQWNKNADTQDILSTSLASKTHLLINTYGGKYVDDALLCQLKNEAKRHFDGGKEKEIVCVLQCQIALAAVELQRGKLCACNDLLQQVLSHPLLLRNFSISHKLTASISSLTSQYIQSLSQPIVDTETCLTSLTTSPSPVCIRCLNNGMNECTCTKHGNESTGLRISLTDLELALDSLKLTKGLVYTHINGLVKDHTHEPSQDSDQTSLDAILIEDESKSCDLDTPTSATFLNSPSISVWNNVYDLLQSLHRVSTLYLGYGMGKEAQHYAREGTQLAKILCLKYWYVKFLIIISEIKEVTGDILASDSLRKQVEQLLELNLNNNVSRGDETALVEKMDELSINSTHSTTPTFLHSSTCRCLNCVNPHRVILALSYLNQLIRRWKYPEKLLEYSKSLLELGWLQVHEEISDKKGEGPTRQRGRRRKGEVKQETSHSDIILPYHVINTTLNVQRLVSLGHVTKAIQHGDRFLKTTESLIHCYIHIPHLRLCLAELHFVLGKAKFRNIDQPLAKNIWEGVSCECLRAGESGDRQDRKLMSQRTVRSDNDKNGVVSKRRVKSTSKYNEATRPKEPTDHTHLLLPFLSNFLISYQLLSPTTLSLSLTRALYHILGITLSTWRTDLAVHFLLLASYLSLNFETILWIRKKIRKHVKNSTCSIIDDILSTLTSSSTSTSSSPLTLNLSQARSILYPLTRPLPLSYTTQLINNLPQNWTYCNLQIMGRIDNEEEKVLVIVRVRQGRECVMMKIPLESTTKPSNEVVINLLDVFNTSLLDEFSSIMKDSTKSTLLTDKRKWWTTRRNLDKQIKELLENLQTTWFKEWRFLLLGVTSLSFSNVASLLKEHNIQAADTWAEALVGGAYELSKTEVKVVLETLTGKCNTVLLNKVYDCLKVLQSCATPPEPHPLIISLVHPLHDLPIESMNMLCNQPVSRIPSLPFLSAYVLLQSKRGCSSIDPRQTYYVINPSGDLHNTEKTFAKWFGKELGWKGVVGRPPTSEEFVYGFEKRNTFIYCGHGRAREYLGSGRVQELNCEATILQMGCSSGKLEVLGNLEPTGMVFNFLLAGCPCLVVNLWDVTDQDIDRFCSTLVSEWLSGPDTTDHYKLLEIVSQARQSCKLKYLVGASPVVYGLPFTIDKQTVS